MICPQCGASNDATVGFCGACGAKLDAQATAAPAAAEDVADARQALDRAVIGTAGQGYYLDRFRRFDAAGKAGAGWHWPAFFTTLLWLLYRKMWLAAGAYFVLNWLLLFVFVIGGAVVRDVTGMVLGQLLYLVVILVLPALLANALYYRHCRARIAATQALAGDPPARLRALAARGGTSVVAVVVAAVLGAFVSVLFIAMMAAISVPAYQDYVIRTRVAEATTFGRDATVSIRVFHERHRRMPHSLEEAGVGASVPPSVRDIAFEPGTEAVVITLGVAPLEGRTLRLDPTRHAEGDITWRCTSPDIGARHLPDDCLQRR